MNQFTKCTFYLWAWSTAEGPALVHEETLDLPVGAKPDHIRERIHSAAQRFAGSGQTVYPWSLYENNATPLLPDPGAGSNPA